MGVGAGVWDVGYRVLWVGVQGVRFRGAGVGALVQGVRFGVQVGFRGVGAGMG